MGLRDVFSKDAKLGIALSGVSILGQALTTGLAQRSYDREARLAAREAKMQARAEKHKRRKPKGCGGCADDKK